MTDQLFTSGVNDTNPEGSIQISDEHSEPSIQDMADKRSRDRAQEDPTSIELKWGDGKSYEFDTIEGFDPSRYQGVADVIKHNVSLRKKISDKPEVVTPLAPEEYEVDTDKFNMEDEFLSKFTERAREANLTQETYDKFLNLAYEQATSEEEARTKQETEWRTKELEKLGPDPEARWNKITNWAEKNHVPNEFREILASNVKTADDVRLWEYVLNQNLSSQPPGRGVKPAAHNMVTRESLQKAMDAGNFDKAQEIARQLNKLKTA